MRESYEYKLALARTEPEVMAVVRDYVSSLHPSELGRIPRDCVPGKLRDGEDVADCAIALTRARIAAADPHPILIDMEAFFAHACSRVSALERKRGNSDRNDPSNESSPTAGD